MVAARSASLSRLFTPPPSKLTTKPPLDGGSADPERNVALFNAVKKARADGVPKVNIESALQKVLGNAVLRRVLGLIFFLLYLGCRREGWSWTACNIRGACARLGRTYHVRTAFTALPCLFQTMARHRTSRMCY
jgi:hypothetical protein